MKKITTFFVALAIALTASAQTWDVGSPNAADVTATLNSGVLTISGTGAMADYNDPAARPWADVRNSITSVVIEDGVTSIGDRAFQDCTGLTEVTIPNSVTSIGRSAFFQCTGLTSVTIPNSVTSIGSQAFWRCTGLTEVTIPNSVTSIGNNAFQGCTGLTSVTIPNSVTNIDFAAFSGCTGLTSVTIPNSVTSIGSLAFGYCTGLTSVIIPNSVTSIGDWAFQNCTGLTAVFVEWDTPLDISSDVFSNVPVQNVQLIVPRGTVNAYRAALVWQDFVLSDANSIIALLRDSIATLQSENSTLNSTITTLQSQNTTLNNSITTLQGENTTLSNSITVLEIENSDLRTQLASCSSTPTSTAATAQSTVKIYPNPTTTGELKIENGEWSVGEAIEVYAMSGALVATYPTIGETTSINLSHLPVGTYVLKVGRYTARFVKQ